VFHALQSVQTTHILIQLLQNLLSVWCLRDLLHLLLQVSVLYLLDLVLLTLAFPFFPFQFQAFLFLQHLLPRLLLLPPSLLLFLQHITWQEMLDRFKTVSNGILSRLVCDNAVGQLTLTAWKALQSSHMRNYFPNDTVPHPTEDLNLQQYIVPYAVPKWICWLW